MGRHDEVYRGTPNGRTNPTKHFDIGPNSPSRIRNAPNDVQIPWGRGSCPRSPKSCQIVRELRMEETTRLTPGQTYQFRFRAFTKGAYTDFSQTVSLMVV